ncbi:MAG: hypothetical protein QOJ25_3385 [Solirubrobacteraceae bacterium]|jgi:hypothetical protein|nr:hypothetical protein [Solirubrobacteraceae bacterium]
MHMSMGAGHGSMTSHDSMTGGGIFGLHGAINLLPDWLAVIWVLVFLGVFLVHIRHLVQTRGPRQLWHAGHILMAIGMAFMFIPASIVDLNIPASFWQLTFAGAALVIVAWMLTEAVDRHPINALWIVAVTDLAAMVYMWSPTGFQAPLTWLLVAYFLVQTLLWATDRMRSIDHHTLRGGYTVTSDGAVGTAVASPLICYRDLRLSMASMTTGMAYMLVAMQLLV